MVVSTVKCAPNAVDTQRMEQLSLPGRLGWSAKGAWHSVGLEEGAGIYLVW